MRVKVAWMKITLKIVAKPKEVIMAINLILFGFIVYTALIVVPSIWEELTTEC